MKIMCITFKDCYIYYKQKYEISCKMIVLLQISKSKICITRI